MFLPLCRIALTALVLAATPGSLLALDLTTANGYNWVINSGGPDYEPAFILPGDDPPGFVADTVPGDWDDHISPRDMNYGWYRLHFHIPEELKVPGRGLLFRVRQFNGAAFGDVDRTYFNGVSIGQTGEFPYVPITPGDADAGGLANYYPGLAIAGGLDRVYRVPSSLVDWEGDNVIAVMVFNRGGSGGLIGIPSIELAPLQASVSGNVYANGTGIFGVRVAAMGPDGSTSDWTITDDRGRFVLPAVDVDDTIIGVAKPGYNAVAVPIAPLTPGQFMSGVAIQTTAAPNGLAPSYDEFADTPPWSEKFEPLSMLDPANNDADPTVYQPGFDVSNQALTIPGTITISSDLQGRSGLLTKQRISKFASVSSVRLVSAQSSLKSGTDYLDLPNVVFHINGNPNDNTAELHFDQGHWIEFNLENYVLLRGEGGTSRVVVRWKVFNSLAGFVSQGPIPSTLPELANVNLENPVVMTVARVGSFYDFYINNERVFFGNIPIPDMADHRIFLYNADINGLTTWDWVRAGPLAGPLPMRGDLDNNGLLNAADVALAVRVAGGLAPPDAAALTRGNVAGEDAQITVLDALRLMQAVQGRPL